MQENIARATVGAGVLVESEDRYLLVQMNYGRYKGHWILPGGMVEKGETSKEAAIRECLEETNLKVSVERLIAVRYREVEEREDNVYYVYKAKLQSSESELQWPEEELMAAKFFTLSEVESDEMVRPLTKLYVKMGLKTGGLTEDPNAPQGKLGRDEVFGL